VREVGVWPEKILPFDHSYRRFAGSPLWETSAKLEKYVTGQPRGHQPVQLILTGVSGTVPLSWENSALFCLPER